MDDQQPQNEPQLMEGPAIFALSWRVEVELKEMANM